METLQHLSTCSVRQILVPLPYTAANLNIAQRVQIVVKLRCTIVKHFWWTKFLWNIIKLVLRHFDLLQQANNAFSHNDRGKK